MSDIFLKIFSKKTVTIARAGDDPVFLEVIHG